jgi:hypothetical protein
MSSAAHDTKITEAPKGSMSRRGRLVLEVDQSLGHGGIMAIYLSEKPLASIECELASALGDLPFFGSLKR